MAKDVKEMEQKKKPDSDKDKQKKEKEKMLSKRKVVPEGVRGIVRMAETDIDGTKKLNSALLKIRGIGPSLALAIPRSIGMDPYTLAGVLSEEQVTKLEDAIANPAKHGIPTHMLDRISDPGEGVSKHIISSTLTLTKKMDIDQMKKIHSYKGIRHELGLPVRGQRTRSSFRTGMTAGVSKVKVQAAAAPAKGAAPVAGVPAAPGKLGAAAPAAGAKPAVPAAGAKPAAAAPAKKEEKKK